MNLELIKKIPFQEDRALVKKDGRWQLIDRAGCVLATQP